MPKRTLDIVQPAVFLEDDCSNLGAVCGEVIPSNVHVGPVAGDAEAVAADVEVEVPCRGVSTQYFVAIPGVT